MTGTPRPAKTLYAIDLLRFVGAALVVHFHWFAGFSKSFGSWGGFWPHAETPPAWHVPYAGYGWIGVELFFAISGYVIAMSATAGSDAGRFFLKRVLRLWPGVALCASVTVILLLTMSSVPADVVGLAWLRSVLLSPWGRLIDASYWTLAVECGFYLMVALMLWLYPRPNGLPLLAVIIGTGSALFWLSPWLGIAFPALPYRLVQILLFQHGCYFALGMWLHRWHHGHRTAWTGFWIGAMLLVGMVGVRNHVLIIQNFLGVPLHVWVGQALFLASVITIATAPMTQAWLEARLKREWVIAAGLLTFPLYLLHQDAGGALIGHLTLAGLPYGAAAAIAIALVFIVSLWIAQVIEPKLRGLITPGWLNHDRRPDNPPTASP